MLNRYCRFVGFIECEPNSSYLLANGDLINNKPCKGYHNPSDEDGTDRDFYKLYLSNNGQITIKLTNITNDSYGEDVQLQIFYENTEDLIGADVVAPFNIVCPSNKEPNCEERGPGWYYILIYTPSGYCSNIPYELTVTYP